MNKLKLALVISVLLAGLIKPANAQDEEKKPIILKFGLFVKKIVPDFKSGTFYTEFYWWTKFTNDSTVTGFSNDLIINLEYVNAKETPVNSFHDEIQESKTFDGNQFYYTGYHQGHFYFNSDFRKYPFDHQELSIIIENSLVTESDLVIEPDLESLQISGNKESFFGLSEDLTSAKSISYKIVESIIKRETGIYNSNFGDPEFPPISKYSRLNFSVYTARVFAPFISKLFIPLAIILFLVYFVFFLPPAMLDIAAALTVTSLLSAIAFHSSVNADLPEIGYLIYIDQIFYSTYFLIALAMAESLYTFYLDQTGEEKLQKLARNYDIISRYVFPLLFLLSIFLFAQ